MGFPSKRELVAAIEEFKAQGGRLVYGLTGYRDTDGTLCGCALAASAKERGAIPLPRKGERLMIGDVVRALKVDPEEAKAFTHGFDGADYSAPCLADAKRVKILGLRWRLGCELREMFRPVEGV